MTVIEAPSEKTDTAARIMQTAEKLFAKKGFECVSIRELAAECGVNISLISYHFGGKEQLLEKIIETRVNSLMVGMQSLVEQEIQCKATLLKKVFKQNIKLLSGAGCFMQIMVNELSGDARLALKEKIINIMLQGRKAMAGIIEAGKATGQFRKDIDSEVTVMILDNGLMKYQQSADISIRSMGGDPSCTCLWSDENTQRIENFITDFVDNFLIAK
ncbi:MAG: TetR/AcrR family transcriptional regulator [Flexibacteraceae bacterium]